MKTLTILLADPVGRLVDAEAKRRGVDASSLCAGLLSEHFLSSSQSAQPAPNVSLPLEGAYKPELRAEPPAGDALDFVREFRGYPERSIELARLFVREALSLPNVRAFKNERGIGFDPNFVFIEYLQKREPGGLMVSFYGGPDRHKHPLISSGRGTYSRARLRTLSDLKAVLPHVRRAYDFKFGTER